MLKAVAEIICTAIPRHKNCQATKVVTFVMAGERPQTPSEAPRDFLSAANDWQLIVNLGRQLKFLAHIIMTSLRPDIILLCESARQVIMLELTVPWEDRMEEVL